MVRNIAALVRFRKTESKVSLTLERLRKKRQNLRDQLLARSTDVDASRRYEADEKFTGEMPSIQASSVAKSTSESKSEKSAPEKTKAPRDTGEQQPSHIDLLLKAKRKATNRGGDDKAENIE
jgi:hypothetical protein